MAQRVNVNFSDEAYDALRELAEKRGTSMSEVLRDAIALERAVQETREEGGHVLLEKDGQVREIIPR